MRLTTLFGAFALTLGANALHAEDAGKVDWHTKLLGIPLPDRPFVPNFHRVPPYRFGGSWKSVILTATESNTVGGLNPADSSIVWRRKFADDDPVANMKVNSDVIALYGRGEPKSAAEPMDPRGPVVLATLSGPGGATLRVFEATTGILTFDTELHKPDTAVLTTPATLSTDIAFALNDETPDIITLSNGHSVTRVNGFTGAKNWTWSSPDAASSTIFTKLAVSHSAVFALGLTKSFRSYTLKIVALDSTTGAELASQDYPSDIEDANNAFVTLLHRTAAFPTVLWVDNGQAMVLDLDDQLKHKPAALKDGKFVRLLDVGLELSGILVGLRADDSAQVLKWESGTVRVAHAFPVSRRSPEHYTDSIYLGTLDRQGRPYVGRTMWTHQAKKGGTHVLALENGQIHGTLFPFDTEQNGLIAGAAIDVAQPEPGVVVSRTFTTSTTGALQLWQNDKLVWGRDEALSSLAAVEFVDLPEKKAATQHHGQENAFSRLVRHVGQLSDLPEYVMGWTQRFVASSYQLNAPVAGELWRDPFGFRKIVIAASKVGKVYALDSTTGTVLWSKVLGTDHRGGDIEPVKVFVLRTAAETANPEVVVVAQHRVAGEPTETLVYHFNALTGFQWLEQETKALGGNMLFTKALKDAYLVSTVPRIIALVDESRELHIYPQDEISNTILSKLGAALRFVLPGDTLATQHMLIGHAPSMSASIYPVPSTEIWRTALPAGEHVLRIIRRPHEHTPPEGLGKVLSDKRTLYRYLNPAMFAVLSSGKGRNGGESSCAISVLDGAKGTLVYRTTVPTRDGTCDVPVSFAQNWLVYQYYDPSEEAKGYRTVTVELYEGDGPDARTSSYDASGYDVSSVAVHAIENSFVSVSRAVALATTTTKHGITTRTLLLANAKNQILSFSRRLLDPRRRLGKPTTADQEEGLIPYEPLLPEDPRMIISHGYPVFGIRHLVTAPAQLESTSLVFGYGLDLFGSRVAPGGTFDVLSETFNKAQLVLTVCALLVGIIVVKPIARNKQLRLKWYS